MATRQTTKKAARKRPQPGKGERKAAAKPKAATEAAAQGAEKTAKKKRTARKLDRKKLGAMVDRMLLQLAERVEEGECTITTSEGVKLIQLREALGLERPSAVKVEWVEPKAE